MTNGNRKTCEMQLARKRRQSVPILKKFAVVALADCKVWDHSLNDLFGLCG